MDKIIITSSKSKVKLRRSGKGLITSLGIKDKIIPKKYKKARYAIINVSKKDLSKIIREFEKLPYEIYEKKRPKHKPTDSYFYPERHLSNCMMRSDALNLHVYPVRTQMNGTQNILTSNVYSKYKSKLKKFLVDKTLSHICSMDEDESKIIIVEKCSTKGDESECVHKNINKQKYKNNEAYYEASSVTDELPSYFNIFECGRNILNRLDMTYELACMYTQEE